MYAMMKVVAALLFVVGVTNAFVSPSAFAGRSMAAGRVRARAGISGAVGAVCSRTSMTVIDVGSSDELDKIVKTDSTDKLVVVDYSTTWCGPCKLILPKYEALSEEYKDAVFVKVIGDSTNEASQLMKREGVRSVPSFHFWKGGKKVDSVNGANEPALEDTLRSLA